VCAPIFEHLQNGVIVVAEADALNLYLGREVRLPVHELVQWWLGLDRLRHLGLEELLKRLLRIL
jgi:hypothetical protein